MPDAPISNTATIDLGQWAEGAAPGAAALNSNWQKIDDAILVLQGAISAIDVGSKADQSSLDATQAELDALEADIVAANYVKADGTVSMAGDLQLDGFKVVNVSAGTNPGDVVNRAQLDAAVSAGLGALAGSYAYTLVKTAVDLDDAATGETSPKTFIGDTNLAATPASLHSTSSNKMQFVASQDGFWMFNARIKAKDFGTVALTWWKNGAEAVESVMPAALHDLGEGTVFITDILPIRLDAGDYVELKVYGGVNASGTILADSSISMLLLSANAVGGGDLKADGSIPMTDPFDNGSQQSKNAGDGTDPTDLTTLQQVEALIQVVQDEVDAVTSGQLKAPEVELTGGDQAVSGTAWVEVSGSAIVKTFAATKEVVVHGEGTAIPDFARRSNLQLGVKIQRTGDAAVIYLGTRSWSTGLGDWMETPVTVHKQLSCVAGEWTFTLVIRQLASFGASTGLYKNADAPARLGLVFTA